MIIRHTQTQDMAAVLDIYAAARAYQREILHLNQWRDDYPNEISLRQDMDEQGSYVVEDEGEIVATFFLQEGPDETYLALMGATPNLDDLVTIHRIGVKHAGKGYGRRIMQWITQHHRQVMIDTHAQNSVMLKLIEDFSFNYLGIVQVADGTDRNTYIFSHKNLKEG